MNYGPRSTPQTKNKPEGEIGHTPTPWRYQGEKQVEPGKPSRLEFHLYTAGGKYGHPATCDREADAKFITSACNLHAELVAALMGMLGLVVGTAATKERPYRDACDALAKLEEY